MNSINNELYMAIREGILEEEPPRGIWRCAVIENVFKPTVKERYVRKYMQMNLDDQVHESDAHAKGWTRFYVLGPTIFPGTKTEQNENWSKIDFVLVLSSNANFIKYILNYDLFLHFYSS